MGNQASNSSQVLSQNIIKAEWTTQNQQGVLLVRNNFSGDEFQLKTKRLSNEQLKRYILREKYSFAFTPKVLMYEHNSPQLNILVQYAPKKIQKFLESRKVSEVQLLNEMKSVLKTLQLLAKKYGCFYLSEGMLRLTKNNDIVIWFNQDFSKNEPQFPLPNGQGQQPMVSKICKIYEKYLSENNKISPCPTFLQFNGKIQQKLQRIRNQMMYQTPRKSQMPINHLYSTRCYSNAVSPVQISAVYSSNQSLNENNFHTRSIATSQSNGKGIMIPISRTQQYLASNQMKHLKPVQYRNNYSIYRFQKPLNPQQHLKYSRTRKMQNQSLRRQSNNQQAFVPSVQFNQYDTQRSSMDSQYARIFRNNQQFQSTINNPFDIRGTNQSHATSYQSLRVCGSPLINLQPCQQTPEKDYPIDSPTSFYKKPSYSIQQSTSKTTEMQSLKMSPARSMNQTGNQELSPSDYNISHSHITDQLNSDFNGVFGSNRSIKQESQIGSPLKRQINSDLRQLFS